MELVTLAIGGIVILVTAGVAWVIDKYVEVQRKNREIDALRTAIAQYAQTYSFEDCDVKIINKCRKYISRKFGNNIEGAFAKCETMEAKKQFATEIVKELSECMGVDVDKVVFEDLGLFTRGCANSENGKMYIVLNEALLIADPEQLVKTTCHELRHCTQFQSFSDNKWGFSSQRVAQWLYSWHHYVDCGSAEAYEAYQQQIIEIDARNFADAVFNS